jgi:hypothetical protein
LSDQIILEVQDDRITYVVAFFLKEGHIVETKAGEVLWIPDEGQRPLKYSAIEKGLTTEDELKQLFKLAKATGKIESIQSSSRPYPSKACECVVVPKNWLRGGKPNQGLMVFNESEYILSVMERRRN